MLFIKKILFDILNLMGPKFAQFDSAVAGASSDEGKVWSLILFCQLFTREDRCKKKCDCFKKHNQALFRLFLMLS